MTRRTQDSAFSCIDGYDFFQQKDTEQNQQRGKAPWEKSGGDQAQASETPSGVAQDALNSPSSEL